MGFWWMSVPWFERMNFSSSYSSRPSFVSTTMASASTSTIVPAFPAIVTSPVSMAARYSRPVPISGGSVIMSGTAWRCMFEPMRARLASLCSRNGISAVATETICAGLTSMYWTCFGSASTGWPPGPRQSTVALTNLPVRSSTASFAWAIVSFSSSAASR